MGAAKIHWDEDWIRNNVMSYASYKEMAVECSRLLGRNISAATLKNKARHMGIQKPRMAYRHYTDEQIEWLKEHYPVLGCRETVKRFNERFNESRTFSSMKNFGVHYGIHVTQKTKKRTKGAWSHREGSKRSIRQSGSTRMECGRLLIKTEDGIWESASRYTWKQHYGDIPEDHVIIQLDNDVTNYSIDNLACVPLKYIGLLQRYGMRSENRILTETGVKWCELYVTAQKNGVFKKLSRKLKELDFENNL